MVRYDRASVGAYAHSMVQIQNLVGKQAEIVEQYCEFVRKLTLK